MRSAEDYIKEYGWDKVWTFDDMVKLINDARKDVLMEAMKVIKPSEHSLMTRQRVAELINEIKSIDGFSLSFQKQTLEERLIVIKNALIVGDLQKDYSKEEIKKLKS